MRWTRRLAEASLMLAFTTFAPAPVIAAVCLYVLWARPDFIVSPPKAQ
jgi:hypothetical protein